MAEAHAASTLTILKAELQSHAGRSAWVDQDGLHLRASLTLPGPRACLRHLRRRAGRALLNFTYALHPFSSPPLFLLGLAVFVALVLRAPPASWLRAGPLATALWEGSARVPLLAALPVAPRVALLAALVAPLALLLAAHLQRLALWLLLRDKAWMRSARAPTLWVRAWFAAVSALTRGSPGTLAFQGALPKQPLPPLRATVERFLESAAQVQEGEALAATRRLAADFLAGEGPRLQSLLQLKAALYAHPHTGWWEKYVYLKGRSSIAVNSNYYCLTQSRWLPTRSQTARAAVMLYQFMRFNARLNKDAVKPILLQDAIPLCMWQYERMFATCRLPGRECDAVKHWDSAAIRHVAVACGGSTFYLNVCTRDGRLRSPLQLQAALEAIRAAAAARSPRPAEAALPALTADDRSLWAAAREAHFSDGQNRRSLALVESALLWLSLEAGAPPLLDWSARGRALIHGDPAKPGIWFDKSLSLLVFADGQVGLNAEHSWADAPVVAHLLEESIITEAPVPAPQGGGAAPPAPAFYDAEGNAAALPQDEARGCGGGEGSGSGGGSGREEGDVWGAIPWALTAEAEACVLGAQARLAAAAEDFDLCVASTRDGPGYGKDFIKRCRVSPDAFIQSAMQLAYFRDTLATDGVGRLENTYESSMTRMFLHGRTETVRPLSAEVRAFVAAMQSPGAAPAEKLAALQAAAARHVELYQNAMAGNGVDRHLFALYCVSSALSKEAPFLKAALSAPWKLSTSQQPQQQTALCALARTPRPQHGPVLLRPRAARTPPTPPSPSNAPPLPGTHRGHQGPAMGGPHQPGGGLWPRGERRVWRKLRARHRSSCSPPNAHGPPSPPQTGVLHGERGARDLLPHLCAPLRQWRARAHRRAPVQGAVVRGARGDEGGAGAGAEKRVGGRAERGWGGEGGFCYDIRQSNNFVP